MRGMLVAFRPFCVVVAPERSRVGNAGIRRFRSPLPRGFLGMGWYLFVFFHVFGYELVFFDESVYVSFGYVHDFGGVSDVSVGLV